MYCKAYIHPLQSDKQFLKSAADVDLYAILCVLNYHSQELELPGSHFHFVLSFNIFLKLYNHALTVLYTVYLQLFNVKNDDQSVWPLVRVFSGGSAYVLEKIFGDSNPWNCGCRSSETCFNR